MILLDLIKEEIKLLKEKKRKRNWSSISLLYFSYFGTGHRLPLHGIHHGPVHPRQELDGQLVTENPLQEAPPHEGGGAVQLRLLMHARNPSDLQVLQLLQLPATAGIEAS